MRGGGAIIVLVGLLLAYLAVSGRAKCLSAFAGCVGDPSKGGCDCEKNAAAVGSAQNFADLLRPLASPSMAGNPYFMG